MYIGVIGPSLEMEQRTLVSWRVVLDRLSDWELWYRGGWSRRDWALPPRLPVGVHAPVERPGDGPLLLGSPGTNRDLAGGDGTQVNLLLTFSHLRNRNHLIEFHNYVFFCRALGYSYKWLTHFNFIFSILVTVVLCENYAQMGKHLSSSLYDFF